MMNTSSCVKEIRLAENTIVTGKPLHQTSNDILNIVSFEAF